MLTSFSRDELLRQLDELMLMKWIGQIVQHFPSWRQFTIRSVCVVSWLADLSRRLKWTNIVIWCRPSVCRRHRRAYTFHIFELFSRSAWWIFTTLGLKYSWPYKCCCFSARSVKGWIHSGAKCAPEWLLRLHTSSSDWLHRKTNRTHESDL